MNTYTGDQKFMDEINDTEGEIFDEVEKANLDEQCPICGGKAGNWGCGTCSGRCWGELYGEP